MPKMYDVSLLINASLPVWPGDPPASLKRVQKISRGDPANVSALLTNVHIGTHIDAPCHFIDDSYGIDQIPVEVLIGEGQVVEIPGEVRVIDVDVISAAGVKDGIQRVLFKTSNSRYWDRKDDEFHKDFVGLDKGAARYLIENGVRLIGADYLSVAPFSDLVPTHIALLEAGVVIVEGLNLTDVPAGLYQVICLPIRLEGSDGAPARAVLVSMGDD
jgi:arylformamidase